MALRYEEFEYDGPAVLDRDDINMHIEGTVSATGRVGVNQIPVCGQNPVDGLIDHVELSGSFLAADDVPPAFLGPFEKLREGQGPENGHVLVMTGPSAITAKLPCTLKRTNMKRARQILHAGYHQGRRTPR